MSDTRHTPGPWRIVIRQRLEDDSVYPRHVVGGSRDLPICYLESDYAADRPYSDDMVEGPGDIRSKAANAHLIAASPTMYDALASLLPGLVLDLRYADQDDDIEALRSRVKTVTDALDKAEGVSKARGEVSG